MGLESTPAQEGGTAYCYGKTRYVKLGDDAGHGAKSLLTPYDPGIRNDTAAMVCFNAIAYAALDGTKDNDELITWRRRGSPTEPPRKPSVRVTPRSHGCGASDGHVEKLPAGVHHLLPPQKSLYEQHAHGTDGHKHEMESGNTRILSTTLYVLRLKWYDFEDLFGKLPGNRMPATLKTQTTTYDEKFYTKRFSLICAFAASALLLGGGCSEDETEPAIGSKGVSSEVFVSSDAGPAPQVQTSDRGRRVSRPRPDSGSRSTAPTAAKRAARSTSITGPTTRFPAREPSSSHRPASRSSTRFT